MMLNRIRLEKALNQAISKIDEYFEYFEDGFPSSQSNGYVYKKTENTSWTECFYTGMILLAYENTNNEKYLKYINKQLDSFKHRIDNKIAVNHHDLGFLYTLSCVAAYKLTDNEQAKSAAIKAADYLLERWKPNGEFIQAWGIYGFALSYLYTKDNIFIEDYKRVTDYFINNLDKDNIPFWDLVFTIGNEPEHMEMADNMLESLIDNYTTRNLPYSNGLLTDAMYNRPKGHNSECNIWGDYFYMEALTRKLNPDSICTFL